MKKNKKDKFRTRDIPLARALITIFLSTLLISGLAWMGWLYNLHLKEKSVHDDQYNIIAIAQSSQNQESLKTLYLAELLNLSMDQPTNLYQFSIKEGIKNLRACPLIKDAKIRKIKPGTLYIDYIVRVPIAYLGDFTNTAIDSEGYLFPFTPFYTPKKIPIIFMGIETNGPVWGKPIVDLDKWNLALKVLKKLEELADEFMFVKQIDVSQAFAESHGKKQIVILLDDQLISHSIDQKDHFPKSIFLRLNVENYAQNLANFFVLRKDLIEKGSLSHSNLLGKEKHTPLIIDFRIAQLAFLKS